jgi:two-component system, chemotaxis family, response regulator Rcp1
MNPRMKSPLLIHNLPSAILYETIVESIPVVILTTSEAEQDIIRTYELHANCYLTKPVDLEQFIQVSKMIKDFWFSLVKLPPSE